MPLVSFAVEAAVGEFASTPDIVDIPSVRPIPANLVTAITERPLFSLSRRPVISEPTATGRLVQQQAAKLMATMVNGEVRVALLHHPGEGSLRRREGQHVGGWQLDKINEGRVRLRQGDLVEWLSVRANPLISGRDQESPPN
ncbi:MAG: hypothetical protein ACR2QH_03805 [Geminicoccaceae bacterium]